jgi:thioesterase domain-containing protein/acyl carrier protein
VVLPVDGPDGEPRLVAYIQVDLEHVPNARDMRAFLAASLPEYMIPSAFVALESFALNANGKIDRGALSGLSDDNLYDTQPAAQAAAPLTPVSALEADLIAIWEQILGVRPIGATDNFFDLGGQSLIAIRLLAQVEKQFDVRLPLAVFFEAPTVRQLAEVLDGEGWTPELTSLVPIQANGSKAPLFCVHGAGGEVMFYHALAQYLGDDQPLYGLQAQGTGGKYPHHGSVEEMARHYIHEIRTVQQRGPYHLAGASLGGVIAFEMAQQLKAAGETVDLLAFFDSFHPEYPRYRPGVPSLCRSFVGAAQTIRHHAGSLVMLSGARRRLYAREKALRALQEAGWAIQSACRSLATRAATGRGTPRPPHPLRSAVKRYVPEPYDGEIVLFRATDQPFGIFPDRTLGWNGLATRGITVEDIDCLHAAMVSEPRVAILAEKLGGFLETTHHHEDPARDATVAPANRPVRLGIQDERALA